MRTVAEIRKSFWNTFPKFKSEYRKTWRQNQYRTDIRVTFVDFVDMLERGGVITTSLANRATL